MADDFQARLKQAALAGVEASKRSGRSIRAHVMRLMDAGSTDGIFILMEALEERGEMPGWLRGASAHEVNAVLSAWGRVKTAMAGYRKEHGNENETRASRTMGHNGQGQ